MILDRNETNSVRGLAALVIVVFHLLIAWECPRVVNLFGSVSVAAFLFLSGYGINESYKQTGLKDFWLKRLRRIIVPFWLFVTVLRLVQQPHDWHRYLLEMTFIDSEFWFIPYLIWCYLVYWIAQRFFSRWLVPVFLLAGILGLNLLRQIEAEQSFSFLAGVMASRYIMQLRQLSRGRLLQAGAVLVIVGIVLLLVKEIPEVHAYKGRVIYNYLLLPIKLSLGVAMVLLPVFCKWMSESRFLYLCGISSLELYMVHMPVVNSIGMNLCDVLLFIVYTAAVTWLFYQVNNRIIAKLI